jgi:hypothetical protein
MRPIKIAFCFTAAGTLWLIGCTVSSRTAVHNSAVADMTKSAESFSTLMERLAGPVIHALVQDSTVGRVGVFLFRPRPAGRTPSEIAYQLTDAFEQTALRERKLAWIERARLEKLILMQEKEKDDPFINDVEKLSLGLLDAAEGFVAGEYFIDPDAAYDNGTVSVTAFAWNARTGRKLAINTIRIPLKEFPRDAVRDEQNRIPPPRQEDHEFIRRH